jgi:hypothetical protein
MAKNPENDLIFEGLYAASRVRLSSAEKEGLRQAFEVMQTFNQRVRKPGTNWEARPLLGYTPRRRGLKL